MRTTRRRVLGVALTVICLAIVVSALGVLSLWVLPAALARHPSHGMTAAQRLAAVNNVRTPLIAFLVAVGAIGTLVFTARTYALNREGNVTDRYSKAVGQLGDAAPQVRIGGVYALERIGSDSSKDRERIIYVLGAFIRERSKFAPDNPDEPSEDVTAALRVAGRLLAGSGAVLNLRNADLRKSDLSDLPRDQVILEDAKVDGARLPRR
jgi:hypothetical protein